MSLRQKTTFIPPGQSPTELKADPFLGRYVLQGVEERILVKSEKRPEKWEFLLHVRGLPPAAYGRFRAAQSVSEAMKLVDRMLVGLATPRTDYVTQMTKLNKNADMVAPRRPAMKIIRRLLENNYGELRMAN